MEQQVQLNDHNKQEDSPIYTNESKTALDDILQKVPTTAEILFYKQQNFNINIQWINWAFDMLEAGYETENLIILAGEDIHCNPFEFSALSDKIFEELYLDKITHHQIFTIYSTYLIKQALQSPNKENISEVLLKLEQLYINNEYNSALYDFYSLSSAIAELEDCGLQWSWNDTSLTKENCYEYALNFLEQWINNPIQENEPTTEQDLSKKATTSNPPKKNMFEKLISFFTKKERL